MSHLVWLDEHHQELPRDRHGVQTIRQFGGRCGLLDVRIGVASGLEVDRVTLHGDHPEVLEHESPGVFRRPARSKSQQNKEPDTWSSAGVMVAEAWSGPKLVDRAELRILPANFTMAEYHQMLIEIGLIAASSASWVQGEVRAAGVERSGDEAANAPGLGRQQGLSEVDSVLRCVKTLSSLLPLLQDRPLSSISYERRTVPVHRAARDRRGIHATLRNPGRRTVQHDIVVEGLDSEENRFLKWIIEHRLLPFVRLAAMRPTDQPSSDPELEEMVRRAVKRNPRLEQFASRVHTAPEPPPPTQLLIDAEGQLERALASQLLRSVHSVDEPRQPTERMLGTPGYLEAYEAYRHATTTWGPALERGLQIIELVT